MARGRPKSQKELLKPKATTAKRRLLLSSKSIKPSKAPKRSDNISKFSSRTNFVLSKSKDLKLTATKPNDTSQKELNKDDSIQSVTPDLDLDKSDLLLKTKQENEELRAEIAEQTHAIEQQIEKTKLLSVRKEELENSVDNLTETVLDLQRMISFLQAENNEKVTEIKKLQEDNRNLETLKNTVNTVSEEEKNKDLYISTLTRQNHELTQQFKQYRMDLASTLVSDIHVLQELLQTKHNILQAMQLQDMYANISNLMKDLTPDVNNGNQNRELATVSMEAESSINELPRIAGNSIREDGVLNSDTSSTTYVCIKSHELNLKQLRKRKRKITNNESC